MSDVVILTIDCWRHDAPEKMPRFREFVSDFEQGEAICQAAATTDVFPTLLASEYKHKAYQAPNLDAVADGITPIQTLFDEAGYDTGAFLASNPFLGKWADSFDTFWNDGMRGFSEAENRSAYTQFDQFWNFVRLQSRVRAKDIGRRARQWFHEEAESPRFLWMHLMDTHGPYYPGLRRGVSTGLLNTYRSILQFSRQHMDAPESVVETVRNLYWECVDLLDRQIEAVLSFIPDDATVIVLADHGEELYNGYVGHARLYDECVRVPCFVRGEHIELDGVPIRQLDIAPTLADSLGFDPPDNWRGEPHNGTVRDCVQMNHSFVDGQEKVYLAYRTADTKLIESYGSDGQQEGAEFYDLRRDPHETKPIRDETHPERQFASEQLSEFKSSERVIERILTSQEVASDAVKKRLAELGYR